MKTIIKYIKRISLLLLLLTGQVSCEKSFLEVVPKGKLIAQQTSDYDLLLNNSLLLTLVTSAPMVMGDEVAAIDPYFTSAELRTQRLFRWDDVIYEADEKADEMISNMENIYLFNKIINEVMDSDGGTESQKKELRAEALAGRAWINFLMINYYGKPYNASTSMNDPGFPIILESDITGSNYTRATVEEVYNFIIDDLTKAIPDLSSMKYRSRMSKPTAEAILGKVYVYMGKFEEALQLFNDAFADLNDATEEIGLYDYNVAFSPGGAFFPVNPAFGPTFPVGPYNKESMYAKESINPWAFVQNEILLTPQTMGLFGSTDQRLKLYSSTYFPFGFVPPGFKKKKGPITPQIGFALPELYLLRAECKARLNDLTGAVDDLETLRKNRMPAEDAVVPAEIAGQKMDLLQFIMDERIREFALEGYRWFDMRRLSVDPLFANATYTHVLYSSTGEPEETYTLRPERFVLRFPQSVIDQNPGMENNP